MQAIRSFVAAGSEPENLFTRVVRWVTSLDTTAPRATVLRLMAGAVFPHLKE
jgi:hypothetical protein